MRLRRICFTIAAVILVQSEVFAASQWLSYHTSDRARRIIGSMRSQYMEFEDKPEGVKLPKIVSDEPKFAKWKTSMDEAGYRWVMLDERKDLGFYDSLYVDSDGDGHLDDESPIKGLKQGRYYVNFNLAGVKFKVDDEVVTYHVQFNYYDYNERNRRIRAYAGCWYQGEVEIDGKTETCFLVDYNANGSFNDRSRDYNCDRILLGSEEKKEEGFVGKYIELGDKLYRLTVAKDGAFVGFREAKDVPFAEVRMPENIGEFVATGKNGLFKRKPVDGVVKLPTGKYRIFSWQINRKDSDGVDWLLKGSWFGKKGDFRVSDKAVAELDIGEPVVSRLDVYVRDGNHHFNQRLRGRLDENISLEKGGGRPSAPSVNIKNKAGDYDRSFALEYG